MVKEIKSANEKEKIARLILEDLEEWFGIEEYREDYIKKSKDSPFLVSLNKQEYQGFLMLKETSKSCVEISCMGVLREFHHQGIGKKLVSIAEEYAKSLGYSYMQVKTVAFGHNASYDQTNRFYQSVGFEPIEIFPTLWDENNPCLLYLKYL